MYRFLRGGLNVFVTGDTVSILVQGCSMTYVLHRDLAETGLGGACVVALKCDPFSNSNFLN